MSLDISQPRWNGFGGSSLPSPGFAGYGSPPASFNPFVPGQFGTNAPSSQSFGSQLSFTPGSLGKSLVNGLVGGLPGMFLNGISSFALDAYSRYMNKKMLDEQRAYDERMTDKANEFNSPVAQKARLMAAGLSEKAAIEAISGGVQGYQPVQGSQPLPYQDSPGFNPTESALQSSGLVGQSIDQLGGLLRNEQGAESLVQQKLNTEYLRQTLAVRIFESLGNAGQVHLINSQILQAFQYNNERYPIELALLKNEKLVSDFNNGAAIAFSGLSRDMQYQFRKAMLDGFMSGIYADASRNNASRIAHDFIVNNRDRFEKKLGFQLDADIYEAQKRPQLVDANLSNLRANIKVALEQAKQIGMNSCMLGFQIEDQKEFRRRGYHISRINAEGQDWKNRYDEAVFWQSGDHMEKKLQSFIDQWSILHDDAIRSRYDTELDYELPVGEGLHVWDKSIRKILPVLNMFQK
ncbi:MAG: hypothetical protein MJZ99_10500 [Bacteroidales bacterium]|nr:hypothetical protein [Bacteroidales bacterium]